MKKILVIAASTHDRDRKTKLLQASGFETFSATNASVGLQQARDHLPHLILCAAPPNPKEPTSLDGYEILNHLHQTAETAIIPIILVAQEASHANFRRAMELGASDYLVEPVQDEELMLAIAAQLKKQSSVEQWLHHQLYHQLAQIKLQSQVDSRSGKLSIFAKDDSIIARNSVHRNGSKAILESIHSPVSADYKIKRSTPSQRVSPSLVEPGSSAEEQSSLPKFSYNSNSSTDKIIDSNSDFNANLPVSSAIPSPCPPLPLKPPLNQVFQYIQSYFHRPIALEDVAKAIDYSPAYLTHLTRQQTGKTVQQWIIEYRMNAAQRLLLETEKTIEQIAAQVGYQHTVHFFRQFRQLHGKTPTAWRSHTRAQVYETTQSLDSL